MTKRNQQTNCNKGKAMHSLIKPAALDALVEWFPQHRDAALRLSRLTEQTLPTVVVLGHYNHGKSSLLNALIGEDCFAVSDKRETVDLQVEERSGIRWVDTPGLDADVTGEDDRKAREAAIQEADLRVLVHAADLGELDRNEAAMVTDLVEDQQESGRAFLLALTRIDKVSGDDLAAIVEAIQAQAPEATLVAVSSHAWMRGRRENKPRLIELGNLDALHDAVTQAVTAASAEREAEFDRLAANILDSLAEEKDKCLNRLQRLRDSRQTKLILLAQGMQLNLTTFNNDLLLE